LPVRINLGLVAVIATLYLSDIHHTISIFAIWCRISGMGDEAISRVKEGKADARERDMGRMATFCEAIANGQSWDDAVAGSFGYCLAMYRAMLRDPHLRVDYELSMTARADQMAHEVLSIADSNADAQLSRNRIDARKWLASKLYPKKYGDRLELAVTQEISINDALTEARSRLLPMRDSPTIMDAQVIDSPSTCSANTTDTQSEGSAGNVDIFS
jgi:hypothetical protein